MNSLKFETYFMMEQYVKEKVGFSPSAGKPLLVAKEFLKQYKDYLAWKKFPPLTEAEISVAHNPRYVHGILDCSIANGFSNTLESVAKSLPYTTGSFYYASLSALKNNSVTISLTSGFHHACYNNSGGFCTFNALMIASILLKNKGLLKKEGVGIIDFDMHYGNGTDDIIKELKISYVKHLGTADITIKDDAIDEPDLLKKLEPLKKCDILFYQAGADIHIDDPLGGKLTTEQMKQRDRLIFQFAKDNQLPLVWNLAGGYQKPIEIVIQLHVNTLKECINVFEEGLSRNGTISLIQASKVKKQLEQSFPLIIRLFPPNIIYIEPTGFLATENLEVLDDKLMRIDNIENSNIIFSFKNLKSTRSSTTWGYLFDLTKNLEKRKKKLILCDIFPYQLEVIKMFGFESKFEIHNTCKEAIEAING